MTTVIERIEAAGEKSSISKSARTLLVDTHRQSDGANVCVIVQPSEDGLSHRIVAETTPSEARYAERARQDFAYIAAVLNAAPAFLALARAAYEEHLGSNLRGRVDGCPECDALAALFGEVGS